MLDAAAIANAAFTIVGALIGAVAALVAARFTWQNQQYNEAASNFRAAFVESIYQLRRGEQDVYRILTDAVVAEHEKAKILLEPFLAKRELASLSQAWEAYVQAPRTAAPGSLNNRPTEQQRALLLIESMLSCAARK